MKKIADFIGRLPGMLEKALGYCFKSYEKAEIQFDFCQALQLVLLFILLFGSGCAAYSIARSRGRRGWFFFILGCLIPVLLPLLMMFFLDTAAELREKDKRKKQKLAQKAEEESILGQQRKQEKLVRAEAAAEKKTQWNQEFFAGIYRLADGSPAGPWKVTYGDRSVIVSEILEIQEELLVVMMVDDGGQKIKMRIPFAKIQSWTETSTGEAAAEQN